MSTDQDLYIACWVAFCQTHRAPEHGIYVTDEDEDHPGLLDVYAAEATWDTFYAWLNTDPTFADRQTLEALDRHVHAMQHNLDLKHETHLALWAQLDARHLW